MEFGSSNQFRRYIKSKGKELEGVQRRGEEEMGWGEGVVSEIY